MDQAVIFQPFVATMLLTLAVWIYMYGRRLGFIFASDNLKNLFELPTLFYALVLYLYVTHQVDKAYVVAAWGFFAFRVLHSVVHCTFNFIPLRFWLYVVSAAALWLMVLRAALAAIA